MMNTHVHKYKHLQAHDEHTHTQIQALVST